MSAEIKKITIEVETTKVATVELNLPFYCRSTGGTRFYAIVSSSECIEVKKADRPHIIVGFASLAVSGGYEEISKEEFMKEYDEIYNQINGRII